MPTLLGGGSTLGSGEAVMSDAMRAGGVLYLSGRAAIDPATRAVVPGGFAAQAERILDDIEAVLTAAGSARDLVLRVECYLADAADFDEWNGIWCAHFKPPRPARTTVVTGFVIPEMLIELQVTAIPGTGDPA